jgi:hypothetical protein
MNLQCLQVVNSFSKLTFSFRFQILKRNEDKSSDILLTDSGYIFEMLNNFYNLNPISLFY